MLTKNYNGITSDSRAIKDGFIFVAIKGFSHNGEDFIPSAIANGANLIIAENLPANQQPGIDYIKVDNAKLALSQYAKTLYPAQPIRTVGVTGTNGKTSVAFFYKQIAEYLGFKSASIGTLGILSNFYEAMDTANNYTSPFPEVLHKNLDAMSKTGLTDVAIEVSSHGLEQYRVDGVNFNAVAFTNLTRDHLDYHKTMEAYLAAKLRLFTEFQTNSAVINIDDEYSDHFLNTAKSRGLKIITYGKKQSDLKIISFIKKKAKVEFFGKEIKFDLPLNGDFQIYNTLCAYGLAILAGLNEERAIEALSHLIAAPGRLQEVAKNIYVDYAHTPDALENALHSLRSSVTGKLILVFGCGGDRDPGKRPQMGEIANNNADLVIVTDDNPRTEDPDKIRKQILASAPNAIEIQNRSAAIFKAVTLMSENDAILVAGKGHENYQIIGNQKSYFSDAEEVLKALKQRD